MRSEAENDSSYTPKLQLFSSSSHAIVHMKSPERSGMSSPPLHALASVPFRWEEEPGKPKPCTKLTTFCNNPNNDFASKCLELPPRLLLVDHGKITTTKLLDGPYIGRGRFQSSSFRMGSECYGSFRDGSYSPDHHMVQQLKTMVVSNKGYKEKGFLGRSWRKRTLNKAKREVAGNSYVFPSSGDRDNECIKEEEEEEEENNGSSSVKITRIRRGGSFSSQSHPPKSHFWASIYEGIKQAVPWSKKGKEEGIMG